MKRVFLIILDSLGIGEAKDAHLYGDEGSNTFKSLNDSGYLQIPNLKKLGIYNIDNKAGYTKEKIPLQVLQDLKKSLLAKIQF